MDKFFSLFGKLVLLLVIVGILAGGGYYLGRKYNLSLTPAPNQMATTAAPTNGAIQVVSPTVNQTQADPHVAITAGGISPFNTYLMSGFKSFVKTEDKTAAMDKITLTNGDYQLVILQAAVGGGGCTFPGEAPAQMSVTLSNPVVEIPLLNGTSLKRGQADAGTNPGKATYTVCQKGSDGHYGSITSFGVINYTVPLSPNAEIVAMMDAMVGSLQKQ